MKWLAVMLLLGCERRECLQYVDVIESHPARIELMDIYLNEDQTLHIPVYHPAYIDTSKSCSRWAAEATNAK